MKVPPDPRLPVGNDKTGPLTARIYELWRNLAMSINGSSMWDGEGVAAPTSGTWAQGDVYRNTAPAEAGTAASKYVTLGWVCTVSGTPGTWLDMRVLTGN